MDILEPIRDLRQLVENVIEYQKVKGGISSLAKPSQVQVWYFIPALHMAGASRFIGYQNITWERYDDDSIYKNGGDSERYLGASGWFRRLNENEGGYREAYELASDLSPSGIVRTNAKFNILTDEYDAKIKQILGTSNN